MNLSRSAFLILFGGLLLTLAISRLRAYRLRERYALVFGFIALPFLGLAFWPDAIGWIAEHLNIQYNTLALLGVSCFLILAVFELLSIVSVQDQKITALSQLVGILMEQQKLVEKEHQAGAEDGLS
jgi:fucose permease